MASSKTTSVPRNPNSAGHIAHLAISPQHPSGEQIQNIDDFSARRSGRVVSGQCVADNDTWVEALAVCEVAKDPKKPNINAKSSGLLKKLRSKSNMTNENTDSNIQQYEAEMAMAAQRLTLRPYFQSQNSGQRIWDEPPSGASNIIYATTESRKMAQAQLEEMRSTYAHESLIRKSQKEEAVALERSYTDQKSRRKLSLTKIFKRSSSSTSGTERQTMSMPLVNSSNNVALERTGIPPSVVEESISLATNSAYDQDLQMAMMLSMGIGNGSVMGVGDISDNDEPSDLLSVTNCTPAAAARREKEQMEMAIALSIAEEKARNAHVDGIVDRKSVVSRKKHSPPNITKSAPAPTLSQIDSDFGGSGIGTSRKAKD